MIRTVLDAWNRFWFDSKSDAELAILGLFRICLASVMLFTYVSRTSDIAFFYSENGILPTAYRLSAQIFEYRPTPIGAGTSLVALEGLHALLLIGLVLLALGIYSRGAAIAVYVLHMIFLNRNIAVQFGVDTIGTFFLFYLCFTPCGARYSLDARLRPRERHQGMIGHVAWRLMQLQVCIIYGFSGLTKLQGVRWWDGSAFWDVLAAGNLQRWDMSFVAHMPIVIASVVYLVLLWEIYFPALIWMPRLRLPMLAFGVLMHLGIFLFMNLPSFGFLMIALYVLFLKEDEIKAGLTGLAKWLPLRRDQIA